MPAIHVHFGKSRKYCHSQETYVVEYRYMQLVIFLELYTRNRKIAAKQSSKARLLTAWADPSSTAARGCSYWAGPVSSSAPDSSTRPSRSSPGSGTRPATGSPSCGSGSHPSRAPWRRQRSPESQSRGCKTRAGSHFCS